MPIDPSSLSGLRLWLRAKDLGAGGSSVTTWTDQSGLSHNATAAGTTPTVAAASTPSGGKSVAFSAGYFAVTAAMLGGSVASPTASTEVGGFEASKAFDGNRATTWAATTSTGWLRFQTSGGAKTATSYSVMAYNAAGQAPAAWTFQGSNDPTFVSWTTLDTRSGVTFAAFEQKTYTFSNSTAYDYYRINVTANGGSPNLAIAELSIDDIGLPDAAEMWIVVKANSGNQGSPIDLSRESLESYYPFSGVVYDGFAGTRQSFTPSVAVTSWRLFRATRNASTREWFLDATSQLSVSAGALVWAGTAIIGSAASPSGIVANFGGNIAEILVRGKVSTSGEVADLITYFNTEHGLTVPGGSTGVTGAVAASAPAPTVSIAGTIPTQGFVSATAPAPVVAITGDVSGVTSGVIAATAPMPSVSIAGDVTAPVTGSVSATAPMATLFVTNALGEIIDTGLGFGSEVTGDAGIDLVADTITGGWGVGSEIVGDITVSLEIIETGILFGSRLLDPRSRVADPRTSRPQVQLRVVDFDGVPSCDLAPRAVIGSDVSDPLNEASEFDFTLPARDPGAVLVTPTAGSKPPMVQLWRGSYLHKAGWYFVIKAMPSDDGAFVTFKCVDIRWPLEGNLIGKTPRRNLLSNGDFRDGDRGSLYGWDAGSTPATKPLHSVVDDDYTESGKALQLIGADKSQLVVSSLSSAAVFVPNSSTYLSGGAAAVQAVGTNIPVNSDVHIVGHTANDGTGDGMALSLARANAAKATLLAQKPSLHITTEGKGYYEPVASNATEAGRKQNRRVVISYQGVDDGTNSAQWESRSITLTNPTSAKRKLPVTAVGWFKLVSFTGPNKDNLAIRFTIAKASTPTKIIDEATVTLDEDTEIGAWVQASVTLEVPANGVAYILRAYYYAPHGTVLWTRRGFYPDDALTFYGTDQALIVKALVEHAQDTAMGKSDWNIGTYCRATGVTRRRVYPYRDHREVADAIWNDFPTLDRGLDVDVFTSPWSKKIRTHYPRQGSVSETVLALGHNVVTYSAAVDLTQTATVVVAQADDIGSFREEAVYRNTTGLGGMVLEKVVAAERETPIDELDEVAIDGVKRFGRPVVDLRVECDPRATSDLLDELAKGDTVRVIIRDAALDIDALYRVVDYPWNPETDALSVGLVLEV